MKVFISYRFTGEDPVKLKLALDKVCEGLNLAGFDNYCSFGNEELFRNNSYTVKQIMEHALAELDKSDALLAFVNSDNKSEGMLIEVGYAIAKGKPVILLKRNGVSTHSLEGVSKSIIEFNSLNEISEKLAAIQL